MGVFPHILCHWSLFWHQKIWNNEIINFKNSDFCKLLRLPIIVQFSKFKNFHWVCWFLGKNLSNSLPPFGNSTTHIAIQHITYAKTPHKCKICETNFSQNKNQFAEAFPESSWGQKITQMFPLSKKASNKKGTWFCLL